MRGRRRWRARRGRWKGADGGGVGVVRVGAGGREGVGGERQERREKKSLEF